MHMNLIALGIALAIIAALAIIVCICSRRK